MLKWKDDSHMARMVVCYELTGLRRDATAADIIACLKANPDAVTPEQWAEVLRGYPEVKRYAIATTFLDTEGYWVSCEARAEQAERSLATVTAERDEAKARLRDVGEYCRELQAHALPTDCVRCGGVGAEPPCCPESGPCECCGGWTAHKRLIVAEPAALRAQLTAVERERDEARAELERRKEELRLAQCPNPRDPKNGGHCDTCSGLSVARTRQLHEQEQRIAELEALNRDNLAMWEVERDALKAMLAEAELEVEGAESMREDALRQLEMARETLGRAMRAEMDLADAWTALGRGPGDDNAGHVETLAQAVAELVAANRDNLAMWDVERESLRARLAKYEAVVEAALKHLEATRWDPQPSKHWKLSREGLSHSHVCDAMDALRALDSSVGVAATAEPAGSWTGDRVWEHHEPATQDPATRAEVEELRRRVDRLESLTDNEE